MHYQSKFRLSFKLLPHPGPLLSVLLVMLLLLLVLLQLGLLTSVEAESTIAMEFNPVRVGFHGAKEVWTSDVLNLGVRPDLLIDKVRGLQAFQNVCLSWVWVVLSRKEVVKGRKEE